MLSIFSCVCSSRLLDGVPEQREFLCCAWHIGLCLSLGWGWGIVGAARNAWVSPWQLRNSAEKWACAILRAATRGTRLIKSSTIALSDYCAGSMLGICVCVNFYKKKNKKQKTCMIIATFFGNPFGPGFIIMLFIAKTYFLLSSTLVFVFFSCLMYWPGLQCDSKQKQWEEACFFVLLIIHCKYVWCLPWRLELQEWQCHMIQHNR